MKIFADQPKNEQALPKLYAVISIEPDGTEGICAETIPGFGSMPLVFGHESKLPFLREWIKRNAKHLGRGARLELVEFSNRRSL